MMIEEQATRWRVIWEGAWGVLAGMVGSLCCIGPSSAILLGLGSSSALFGLQLDQRLALGGGIMLLIGGGLMTMRQARICNLRLQSLWRRIILMLASGIAAYGLLGVLAPWAAVSQEQAVRTSFSAVQNPIKEVSLASPPSLRQATLTVEKMDCPPCVTHLSSLLSRKPFVERFEAHINNEQLRIVYDSNQIDAAQLLAMLPQQYRAELNDDRALP